jgi:hypothetical protein
MAVGEPFPVKIGVVLLNWQNWQETVDCLHQLESVITTEKDVIPIVVDNGSKDDSVSQLKLMKIPHLVCLDVNLGYAGGCNVGIQKAIEIGCETILLMNSDVDFQPGFLEPLLGNLKSRPQVGIVSPKIINDDNPAKIYYAGGKIYPFRMKDRLVGIGKLDSPDYDQEGPADFGIGCCLLIKREVFEKVGFLDERFFFDYEDVDFCYRARQMGYSTWYTPDSIVIHKAPLLPRNKRRAFLLGLARITFFNKYITGRRYYPALFLEWVYTFRVMANHILRRRLDLALGYLEGVLEGMMSHAS